MAQINKISICVAGTKFGKLHLHALVAYSDRQT